MIYTKCGRWHAEQDTDYESEQDCNGVRWRTKRVSRPTWAIYERVGSPSYQTPRFTLRGESAARAKLSELGEILVFSTS